MKIRDVSRISRRAWFFGVAATILQSAPLAAAPVFTQAPRVIANPNQSAPLAAVVAFEADQPVSTKIRITDGEHEWELSYESSRDPAKGLPVIGMRPDRMHELSVFIQDASGAGSAAPETLRYRTPALPSGPADFPSIEVAVSKREQMEPGFRLLNPRRRIPRRTQRGNEQERRFGADFGMLLMTDAAGEPVWYYRSGSRISDFQYLDNGHILYVTQDYRIVEIDLLGNRLREWYAAERPQGPDDDAAAVPAMTFHHDADVLSDGRLLALSTVRRRLSNYYTSEYDAEAPRKTQWVMGDRVVEFNQQGRVLWEWNAFEHMDPYRIGYETFSQYWVRRGFEDTVDWSHANSAFVHPEGQAVVVNFRLQSAIIQVDRKTGRIRWIFGEPGGWPERLQDRLIRLTDGSRWFWHQHSPTLTSRGTLLLFDNGNYRARPFEPPAPVARTYSRAVEYEIDEENRTARLVWSSEAPGAGKVVSIAMGSVSEMPETGNILVGYGALLDSERLGEIDWRTRARIGQWTLAREYTRSSPPEVVWEIQLTETGADPPIGWTIFGVQLVPELRP